MGETCFSDTFSKFFSMKIYIVIKLFFFVIDKSFFCMFKCYLFSWFLKMEENKVQLHSMNRADTNNKKDINQKHMILIALKVRG